MFALRIEKANLVALFAIVGFVPSHLLLLLLLLFTIIVAVSVAVVAAALWFWLRLQRKIVSSHFVDRFNSSECALIVANILVFFAVQLKTLHYRCRCDRILFVQQCETSKDFIIVYSCAFFGVWSSFFAMHASTTRSGTTWHTQQMPIYYKNTPQKKINHKNTRMESVVFVCLLLFFFSLLNSQCWNASMLISYFTHK